MKALSVTLKNTKTLDERFREGYEWGANGRPLPEGAKAQVAAMRRKHGFAEEWAPMLTKAAAQDKFKKSKRPQAGLLLAPAKSSGIVNTCAWSGVCATPCVAHNGNGSYPSIKRARAWRTDLLATMPAFAVWQIGFEVSRLDPDGWFRPDTFSDIGWWGILPSMPEFVTVGGYSKNPYLLLRTAELHEWNTAYSWNENSDAAKVRRHLAAGGKVAIVTDRKRGAPVTDALARHLGVDVPVVDADLTDEWVLQPGPLVGDLTAKGRALRLIVGSTPDVENPRFVEEVYGTHRLRRRRSRASH